ncbi:MAG: hypothetical protein A3J45_03230 [Candidatus Rokubacteria bacterium RIFCSPHIGHO2_02_FULL_69_13]|nr:MAG: hypothetical protein A3J45_03230 [Candidatus Rokubacteria bacterium RIFCSPHIGHO2_02_FULL_69_13]
MGALDRQSEEISVIHLNVAVLHLNGAVEVLDSNMVGVGWHDPRKTGQVFLAKPRLDLCNKVVDGSLLVFADPGSRDDQIPTVRNIFAHEEGEKSKVALLLRNFGF